MIRRLLNALARLLFGPRCVMCHFRRTTASHQICDDCWENLYE